MVPKQSKPSYEVPEEVEYDHVPVQTTFPDPSRFMGCTPRYPAGTAPCSDHTADEARTLFGVEIAADGTPDLAGTRRLRAQ